MKNWVAEGVASDAIKFTHQLAIPLNKLPWFERSAPAKILWPELISSRSCGPYTLLFPFPVKYKKPAILNHFVMLSRVCYWEENIGKQRMQPSKSISSNVFFLSIPFNKLPWFERSAPAKILWPELISGGSCWPLFFPFPVSWCGCSPCVSFGGCRKNGFLPLPETLPLLPVLVLFEPDWNKKNHCQNKKVKNGILLAKLFWSTVRKIVLVIKKNFWNSRLKADN